MCWNQVENEKKKMLRKRTGERKREGFLESRKQRKQKGRGWDIWIWVYVCGGEKPREKKEEKKRMNDRKKERKNNI